jgi:hypothetical protein
MTTSGKPTPHELFTNLKATELLIRKVLFDRFLQADNVNSVLPEIVLLLPAVSADDVPA